MDVKKAIKKVVAITASAALVGATLGAAYAADLKNYPSPFVVDGVLSPTDSVIVVGESAQTPDVVGAIEIAASLQAEAVSEKEVDVGDLVEPTIDDGVKIEKTGNKFNYGDNASSIQSVYDDADMDFLEQGEFADEDFTQTLTLYDSSTYFVYDSPGKKDKTEFDANDYLYFPNNAVVYEYELSMDSTLTYDDLDDLETETLDIQGNTYTITDISAGTSGQWTEITMLAGETTRWLEADQPLTIGDNTIVVISVSENELKCVIEVNGVSQSIDVGETKEIGDLQVGVTDAFASHTKENDACEVNIGASEVKIVNGDQVKVNGAEIKGSLCTITGNETAETFDGFNCTYTMDDDDFEDDEYGPAQYKMPGDSWIDPLFGNWKIEFDSVGKVTEELTFTRSGDEATLKFKNLNGDDVEVDMYVATNVVRFGDSSTGPLLWQTGEVDVDGDPDAKLWYVLSNGELHILEYDDFDSDTNKIDFNDLTDGKSYTTSALSAVGGTKETVTLGSLGNIVLGFKASDNILNFSVTGTVAQTEKGAEITLNESISNAAVYITSPNEDSSVQGSTDDVFNVTMSYDSSDTEIDIAEPQVLAGAAWHAEDEDKVYNDNDVQMYMSIKGIMFEYDTDDSSYLYVTYPEEDAYANVFIAPLHATITAGGDTGVTTQTVNKIPVGLAVLDSAAESMNKNMIVVGGPCVNTIAAELAENPASCTEGYEEGKAKLKYYTRNGKVALLVAGYSAQDTLGASYVLAHPETYDATLTGDEMEVVVANLQEISVVSV